MIDDRIIGIACFESWLLMSIHSANSLVLNLMFIDIYSLICIEGSYKSSTCYLSVLPTCILSIFYFLCVLWANKE